MIRRASHFFFMFGIFGTVSLTADEVVLVEDGKAASTIVAGRDDPHVKTLSMRHTRITYRRPAKVLEEAAADLAAYLNAMGGIWNEADQVRVVDHVDEVRTPYRVLLGSAAIEEYGLADEAAAIPYPGYVYRVIGNDLLIYGSSAKGAANGVYGFLQDQLGVRWFGPQEIFTVIPEAKDISVASLHESKEPSFAGRLVHVDSRIEHPSNIWARRKMRMAEPVDDGEPFRNNSHNLHRIFQVDRYFTDHPEYYAVRDGRRQDAELVPRTFAICHSNPAVVDIATEAALAYFRGGEHRHSFALGINDGMAYCECDECAKLQPEREFRGRRVASDMYFHFVNEVARRVAEEFPDRYIGVIAYNDVTVPPVGPVEPNVHVVLVNDISEYFDPDYRAMDEELVAAWEAKGVTMGLYYYTQLAKLVPAYFPRLLAEELKDKHDRGYTSVTTESGEGWPWHGPMSYVEARLLWDVDLDVDELLDEYFATLFGPAAPHMRRMYELFEEIHLRRRSGGFLNEHYTFEQFRPYNREDLEKIKKYLAQSHEAIEEFGFPTPQANLEERRLAYVSNGLKVFLDMLEGYVLARELEIALDNEGTSGASAEEMDDLEVMALLNKLDRINDIMARHNALYRETIILDPHMPGRFTRDTATPVRNQWKRRLSTAVGDALVRLHSGVSSGEMLLEDRTADMLAQTTDSFTADPQRGALFAYKTGQLAAGENRIANPGFENGGEQKVFPRHLEWQPSPAFGWAYWQLAPGTGTFDVTSKEKQSGSVAGRMRGIGNGCFITLTRGVKPGELYYVAAHVKNTTHTVREAKPYLSLEVWWLDDEDKWSVRRSHQGVRTEELDQWIKLEQVVEVPPNTSAAAIMVWCRNLHDGEEVFVDDVSFRELRSE